ncbi:MAG TPA: hypothetical protein VH307_03995 [Streptosporangiaceae bacterium]|nr:hypothetical protein [Streptosporangiaceae bacterium]
MATQHDDGRRQPAEPGHAAPRPSVLTLVWRVLRRVFRTRPASQRHRA